MIRDYRREHMFFILIINDAFKEAAEIMSPYLGRKRPDL